MQPVKPLLKVVLLVVQNFVMTIIAHAKSAPKTDGSMTKASSMECVKEFWNEIAITETGKKGPRLRSRRDGPATRYKRALRRVDHRTETGVSGFMAMRKAQYTRGALHGFM